MQIGLFFGSFNPVHVGHLVLANHVLQFTDCKEVWMVVSPQNPHKDKNSLAGMYDRLEMVKLATENSSNLKALDIEFSLPQPSYTIDTLAYLSEKYPKHTFSLIMGADNLVNFHKWKNYEVILKKHSILVYPRPNYILPAPYQNMENVIEVPNCPIMEISASAIRQSIKSKKSVDFLVPKPVIDFIDSKGLYQ